MEDAQNRTLNVFINTGEAQKSYDKLILKEKELNDQLKTTTDPKRIQQLNGELAKLSEPITRASKKLSGELGPSMRDMQKLATQLGNQLKHMSEKDADYSKVVAQYRQAQVEMKGMQGRAKELGDAFEQTQKTNPFSRVADYAKGTLLAGAVTGVISQFTGFLKGSIDEALDAEESTARFRAQLDNIGRSDVFDRFIEKTNKLQQQFKYLDNDDFTKVFEKLVNYGKLTEKQMDELMPVIVNFAAKQRMSITDASDVITKALEGQGKALKEYGIKLDKGADSAQQFNVIMEQLAPKVQGAADAFQSTAAGQIASTTQQIKDLKEEIGTELLPVLQKTLGAFDKWLKGIQYMGEGLGNFMSDIKAAATGGITGVMANRAARMVEEQGKIEAQAVQNILDKFNNASKSDIQKEIDKVQGDIKVNEPLVNGGFDRLKRNGVDVDPDEVDKVTQRVRVLKLELKGLQDLQKVDKNKVIGLGGYDGAKDAEARKKALEEYKLLMKELHKMQEDINLMNLSEEDRDYLQMEQRFADLRVRAKGHADALKLINDMYWQEHNALQLKWARKDADDQEKILQEREKRQQEYFAQAGQLAEKSLQRIHSIIEDGLKKNMSDQIAGIQVKLLQDKNPYPSQARLGLQKALLQKEMEQELQNTNLTENQKELIREQFRQKTLDADKQYWQSLVSAILDFAQKGLQILQTFSQGKTQQENQELARDQKVNDHKKQTYQSMLESKRMTQQDYDRKVAEMDKNQQAKEKQVRLQQFRREQRFSIINALMQGAQGVQKDIAEWGMPYAIPWIAMTAAMTAAQVATISKQSPPQFAKGGFLSGPSHQSSTSGMPVVNPLTGQVQALMEGGEAITNKRTMADAGQYTVSGTPSQIISKLNAMHGGVSWSGGANLVPRWKNAVPSRMNFDGINQAMRSVKMFASGGLFEATTQAQALSSNDQNLQVMAAMTQVMHNLQQTLDGGVHSIISLNAIQDATTRRNNIIQDATMRP